MVPTVRWQTFGDVGWLGDVSGGTGAVLAVARSVRAARIDAVVEVVPGAATVLVVTAAADHDAVGRRLRELVVAAPQMPGDAASTEVVLRAVFDGVDLGETAAVLGRDPEDLVAVMVQTSWSVAFCGFAPGFGYLVGGGLEVPRLAAPRVSVPPGALALAGPYAGVYPRSSPGGWRLVGRVLDPDQLFDPSREPPARLVPGATVRFEHP